MSLAFKPVTILLQSTLMVCLLSTLASADVKVDRIRFDSDGSLLDSAPTLSCVVTPVKVVDVAAGATANSIAENCSIGYVQTSTNCESGSWEMPFVFQNIGICSARNNGAASAQLRASRTCCKVQ